MVAKFAPPSALRFQGNGKSLCDQGGFPRGTLDATQRTMQTLHHRLFPSDPSGMGRRMKRRCHLRLAAPLQSTRVAGAEKEGGKLLPGRLPVAPCQEAHCATEPHRPQRQRPRLRYAIREARSSRFGQESANCQIRLGGNPLPLPRSTAARQERRSGKHAKRHVHQLGHGSDVHAGIEIAGGVGSRTANVVEENHGLAVAGAARFVVCPTKAYQAEYLHPKSGCQRRISARPADLATACGRSAVDLAPPALTPSALPVAGLRRRPSWVGYQVMSP